MTKRSDDTNRDPARPETSVKNPRPRARSSKRVTTTARREAARRNGRQSRGPMTPAGKARSSRNAIRHNLTSARATLPGDDPKVYEKFRHDLRQELAPDGALQDCLAELAIVSMWKAELADRIDTGALAQEMRDEEAVQARVKADRVADDTQRRAQGAAGPDHDEATRAADAAAAGRNADPLVAAVVRDAKGANVLGTIARYRTTHIRTMFRALHEVQRLQAEAAGETVLAPAVIDVDVEGAADQN